MNGQLPGSQSSGPSRNRDVTQPPTRKVVRRIQVRSVLKVSVVFYVAVYCILLVATTLLWSAATATGLRDNIEQVIGDLIASGKFHFVGSELLQAGAVGGAMLVVFGTAANVMLTVLYNLISDLVGGLSLVIEERSVPQARPARANRSDRRPRSTEKPRVTESPRAPEAPVAPQTPNILVPEVERRQARPSVATPTPPPEIPEQPLSGVERAADTNLEAFGL